MGKRYAGCEQYISIDKTQEKKPKSVDSTLCGYKDSNLYSGLIASLQMKDHETEFIYLYRSRDILLSDVVSINIVEES
jgi:hypothetical protein